jgi:hypothetical protein
VEALMGYDVLKRKCGAHNRIIGNRETCPQCASDLRAQMGPRPEKLTLVVDEATLYDAWVAGARFPTAPLTLEDLQEAADHVRRVKEDASAADMRWFLQTGVRRTPLDYSLADKMLKIIYDVDPAFK